MEKSEWWQEVEMKLLLQTTAPEQIKLFRPMSGLESAAKWFSRGHLHVSRKLDVGVAGAGLPDRALLGIRKSHSCLAFASAIRARN